MKKLISVFCITLLFSCQVVQAGKYYWVGNGGNWSDTTHWANSSGGVGGYSVLPGAQDTVVFDAASFTGDGEYVYFDVALAECAMFDCRTVDYLISFSSWSGRHLKISGNCYLSDKFTFDFIGILEICSSPGKTFLDIAGQTLYCDLIIRSDSLFLAGELNIPYNDLFVTSGYFNTNGYKVSCGNLNTDSTLKQSVTVDAPMWVSNAELIVQGSMAVSDQFEFIQNGPLTLNFSLQDSCYLTFADNTYIYNNVIIEGSNHLFLNGALSSNNMIEFRGGGTFHSEGFSLTADKIYSATSINRTIDLDTSLITLKGAGFALYFNPFGLDLISDSASFRFTYSGETPVKINSGDPDFQVKEFHLSSSKILIVNSLYAKLLSFDTLTELYLARGTDLKVNTVEFNNDCGHYNYISDFCSSCPFCPDESDCDTVRPVFQCLDDISVSYFKIRNIKVAGNFTALNSFNEGHVTGIDFIESALPDTLYWINSSGNWNDPFHWSAVPGGDPGACIPDKATDVFFTAESDLSNSIILINGFAYCRRMVCQDAGPVAHLTGKGTLVITDSIILNAQLSLAPAEGIILKSYTGGVHTILAGPSAIQSGITIDGTASWELADDLTVDGEINIKQGELKLEGNSLSCQALVSVGNQTRALDYSYGSIDLYGADTLWQTSKENFIVYHDNARVRMLGAGSEYKVLDAGGITFDTLDICCPKAKIAGGFDGAMIRIHEGVVLECEPFTTILLDTLDASGTPEKPIIISNYKHSPDTAVLRMRDSNDTIVASYLIIKNVCADDLSQKHNYIAHNSVGLNKFSGWALSDTFVSQVFRWTGSHSQSWNDRSNWIVGDGVPVRLPGPGDDVIFNAEEFQSEVCKDTVIVESNAFCRQMNWAGSFNNKTCLLLSADLFAASSVVLCDSLTVAYSKNYHLLDGDLPFFILGPQSDSLGFDPRCHGFNVNLCIQGKDTSDKTCLTGDFISNNLCSFVLSSGRFCSEGKSVSTGIITSAGHNMKSADFKNSNVTVKYDYLMQDTGYLDLTMDSSKLVLDSNQLYASRFAGGGQIYHDLEIRALSSSFDLLKYSVNIEGNNTFHHLGIHPGVNLILEGGSVQHFDSLTAQGNCIDSIRFVSSDPVQAVLYNHGSDSLRGSFINVRNIKIEGKGASALFSKDFGSNEGWVFDSSKKTIASFMVPPATCFNEIIHFTNNSFVKDGDVGDLVFFWHFGDSTTSYLFEPGHAYTNAITYNVSLKSTDTISGCYDVAVKSLSVYQPQVQLHSSDPDLVICQNDTITFTAFSTLEGAFYQFFLNDIPLSQSSESMEVLISNLQNGDRVKVLQDFHGCLAESETDTFTVKAVPVVDLLSLDPGAAVCYGAHLEISGSGADLYQLFLNNAAYGAPDTVHEWLVSDLGSGDQLRLYGQDTLTGCGSWSQDTIVVLVYPPMDVSLQSSDTSFIICYGEPVIFTASNAALYQFYINGVEVGVASSADSLLVSNLNNGDIVGVSGISEEGCFALSNTLFEFIVNPSPQLSLFCSDPDHVICLGEALTFEAFGAGEFQFIMDGDTMGGYNYVNSFDTDSLFNGQSVSVSGRIGDCYDLLDTAIIMTVKPRITLTWSPGEICENDTMTFVAHGDSIYTFYVNNVQVLSGDSVFQASNLVNGQLVTVMGTEGACTPEGAFVTVNALPVISVSCSEPDTMICEGDVVSFTASGGSQYAFFVDGVQQGPFSINSTFTTNSLIDGQLLAAQAYSLDGCLGISADSFVFTVRPYPSVQVEQSDPDLTLCAGDTVTFTASGAETYEFYVNGLSQNPAGPLNTFSISSLANGSVVEVYGKQGYCTAVSGDVFTYTVNPIPVVTFTAITPITYCSGDTVKLLATGATSYEFFIDGIFNAPASLSGIFQSSDLVSGQIISVIGTDNGCPSEGDTSFQVTVNNYPQLLFTANMSTTGLCYGDTVVFEGSGSEHYIFYLDNIPVSQDSVFHAIGLEEAQTVKLDGGNGACWTTADTVYTIHVNYIPLVLSCLGLPTGVACYGSIHHFEANGADLYEFFVDGVSQGQPSPVTYFIDLLEDSQIVSVQGTSLSTGCTQEAIGNILVHVLPRPLLSPWPSDTICEGDSVLLSSSVTENLSWYRDDILIPGATSSELYVYDSGRYNVESIYGGVNAVFSAGANFYGQLGDSSLTNALHLQQALGLNTVTDLACGAEFTFAVLNNGSVMAWGRNEYGSLGNGNYTDSPLPVQVGSLVNVLKVAAGSRFGMAILENNTLVSWGENTYGQLGYGNFSTSNFPFPVGGITQVTDIAAGDNHSLALTANGEVWAWGRNQFGQLGDSTFVTRNSPVKVKGIQDVVAIRAGGNHSMALKNDGSLWVWGSNGSGQLGNGTSLGSVFPVWVNLPMDVASFDGGFAHSIAADTAGHVYCWGDNTFGQIGNAALINAMYPVKISSAGKVNTVRAGQYSSYALRNDNSIFSWGLNSYGQLGQQSTTSVTVPQAVTALFGVKALDAGNLHIAAVTEYNHACESPDTWIQLDTIPDIMIYRNGLVLYTNVPGIQYQWYYNDNPVPGGNTSSINIGAEGVYKVYVTFANQCSGFSQGYNFYVGQEEIISESSIQLFPNPNDGFFSIQLSEKSVFVNSPLTIRILDVLGRCIRTLELETISALIYLQMTGLQNGMYTVELVSGHQKVRKSFVVVEK
ncbi:MAG: T9SS type A sorting domain-containing protein [Bacteroidales bacterium]